MSTPVKKIGGSSTNGPDKENWDKLLCDSNAKRIKDYEEKVLRA